MANYPFCTIEPNVGVVNVPDERLGRLERMFQDRDHASRRPSSSSTSPAWSKGASKGEGLGNQFLANIREVDAIVHVVRCFEEEDVPHPMGTIDPVRDIEVVTTELVLSDLDAVQKAHREGPQARSSGEKEAHAELALLERLVPHLNAARPANMLARARRRAAPAAPFPAPHRQARHLRRQCRGGRFRHRRAESLRAAGRRVRAGAPRRRAGARQREDRGRTRRPVAREDAKEFLRELGVADSGGSALIRATYALLGLITFFTHNEKEVRAWTVRHGTKAPQAAGVIHTDFEKGFIKAEVISADELLKLGSVHHAREVGHYRLEGRDYIIRDGDVILFRFNV